MLKRPANLPQFEPHATAGFAFYICRGKRIPFKWHHHPEFELFALGAGRGIRIVGDSIEEFCDGDVCLIGANLPHTWRCPSRGGGGYRLFLVQFLPDFMGRSFLGLPEMRALRRLFQKAANGLKITGVSARRVLATLATIAKERPKASRRFLLILSLLMDLAESKDLRTLSSTLSLPSVNPRIDQLLQRVLDYLRDHFDQDPSETKVAALAGMSATAFSRFFRRNTGKTYIGFVTELKVSRACAALLETDQTVAEVAYGSGFRNLANFNQHFRRYKKMTPIEYRRRILREF